MRLLEAIIDANHRALAGDASAGLRPADFEADLPLVALTCIDVRLNGLLPQVLGIPPEEFIWLRNAGNIITGPMSSTMRSLALACAVKGGKEIAIIGHTDCQVSKTTTMELLDRLRALGVERHWLPDNLNEFFGIFSSERQNVLKAVELARSSPLIGPKVPVHGLVVEIQTGKLEWLVNGYQNLGTGSSDTSMLKSLANFELGEMKFPETKIGEVAAKVETWVAEKAHLAESQPPAPPAVPPAPPKLPQPPPLRPRVQIRRGPK